VVILHVLEMGCDGFQADGVLLVQGTGTMKSAVPQTVGVEFLA